jgi:acyl-CoA dehydrogenase
MSDTEREALEAGDVWWDADSLHRQSRLVRNCLAYAPATLTRKKKAFLHGPGR